MRKIVIIGGGASGLVASIYASQNGDEVLLIDRNPSCAKKILLTGNGKCNYWNEEQNVRHYHTSDTPLLHAIITEKHNKEILSFFDGIGIVPKIKKGYYYPYSMQSTSIKEALLLEAKRKQVTFINNICITDIEKKENGFVLNPKTDHIKADVLVLATGSKACPKTGSDGTGYDLARQLGHSIVGVLPSLAPLKGSASYLKDWAGIRCEATLTLEIDGREIKKEGGELQLTSYGISGICTFNLSGFVAKALAKKEKVEIKIDFLPYLPPKIEKSLAYFNDRNQKVQERTLEQLLEPLLHYKLVRLILKQSHLSLEDTWQNISDEKKRRLISMLRSFPFNPIGVESFEKAQVCTGGVPLREINVYTMESLKVKNLHMIGELLDVDGDCGGYNLSFAWISGMLAGKGIGENK